MIMKRAMLLCLITCLCLQPSAGFAQTTLEEVVQKTITNNPGILASWNAFQEAVHEQNAAFGSFLPSIDMDARVANEDIDRPFGDDSYQPTEAGISLTQLIFDGFSTSREVKRLGFSKLVSYYEVLQTSENTALEAVNAYIDVLRYRQLLNYADENFYQHQQVFQQVKKRVDSGLGRGVNLDQATGRLALANSNRITEANNLHDVTARFLRIVGEPPAMEMAPLPDLVPETFPKSIEGALRTALNFNPEFNKAIENVRAAQMARDVRKSNYWPRLEFRAKYHAGRDRAEIDGRSEEGVVELAMTYNLFRGGTDREKVRQSASRLNRTKNLREKACRDIRQTTTIAYDEIGLLERQLGYAKIHMDAISDARHAYRKQFDIGQRSLLDLLDSENEFFRARRAYTLTAYDYLLAHAKTLASMGQLLKTLGIRQNDLPLLSELGVDPHDLDPLTVCPATAIPESLYSTATSVSAMLNSELNREIDYDGDGVLVSMDECPGTPSGIKVDANGCPENSKKYVTIPVSTEKATVLPQPDNDISRIEVEIENWRKAWSEQRIADYLAFYSPDFHPSCSKNRSTWESLRRSRLTKPKFISVSLQDLIVEPTIPNRVRVKFTQSYKSNTYVDTVTKLLEMRQENGHWKILSEIVTQ